MARGAVSAARMTISEMPLVRVLVARGLVVGVGEGVGGGRGVGCTFVGAFL